MNYQIWMSCYLEYLEAMYEQFVSANMNRKKNRAIDWKSVKIFNAFCSMIYNTTKKKELIYNKNDIQTVRKL